MIHDRALLMTDLVDSTALSRQLGDDAMSSLWQAHDRAARDLLRRWRGREIDKSDGFLLLFADVSDAVGYALDYHRALSRLGERLQARVGLHLGPTRLRENASDDVRMGAKPLEVDGLAKALAARVMSVAQGGQTLLTAQARAALRDGVRIESHGHWRVKGLDEPMELFEVGEGEAPFTPPPDTDKVYRVVRHDEMWLPLHELRHSLPAERDAFIGRKSALDLLAKRFSAGVRLVSIAGVGGIGKTRLAQRFGWTWLGDFPGGVWFCDLSQARSLDGIAQAVAEGMGIPLGNADPVSKLGDALAGRGACLLILDNFEQVADFAEATVGQWLDRAPAARVLVTSREILGIRGEEVLDLEPLAPGEAAALYMKRTEAAQQDYRPGVVDQAAIDPLMKLLDGLPLAIELAAARVKVMPPRTLLKRMSERFSVLVSGGGGRDRQATLRAAFDWSWELLDLAERTALAQLSVFEGGFTLRAVEATLDLSACARRPVPLDVLQSLVDKSLVRRNSDERFGLLVAVQEYAAEHLCGEGRYEGSGPAALRSAQARHFAFFGHAMADESPAELGADLDNLVAACRRASACADGPAALGALQGACSAIKLRGPFRLAVELADTVRGIPDLAPGLQARVDLLAGRALSLCGRGTEASERYAAALMAARRLNDIACEGGVLVHLGDLHIHQGRMDDARLELSDALAVARATRDSLMECEALTCLGNLYEHLGSMVDARSHYEAALAAARAAGHRRWEGGSLGNLGLLHANTGRMAEARQCYEAAIEIACELGDRQWEGNTRCNLGLLHHVQNHMEEAREQLGLSLQIARELGHRRLECIVQCNLGMVCEALQAPAEARVQYEGALSIARDLRDKRSAGQFLTYLGLLDARQGSFDDSRRSLDESERLLTEVQDRLSMGLLLCARAESESLAGAPETAEAALRAARALAAEVGAEPESEFGLALARVGAVLAQPGDGVSRQASC